MDLAKLSQLIEGISRECGGTVSVAVRDIENAADFGTREDIVVSAASVIKIAILIEALRQVKSGALDLSSELILTDAQKTSGAGVARYFHSGIPLTLMDLLTLMIIVSDNSATNVVIDLIGMDSVNQTMSEMGYPNTQLKRKMMDWDAIKWGLDNTTTARETSELLASIARKEALGGKWDDLIVTTLSRQQDTRKLGLFLPEGAELANKTGGREGIEHDCGIITAPGVRYSIAVLTSGARSPGDAVVAIGRISRAVYEELVAER